MVDAISASTAIPGVFPAVDINGEALMDGAVAANTPVRLAADLGASRIIILPTGYACALKEPPKRAIARALHAITLMIAWQLIYGARAYVRKYTGSSGADTLPARGIAFRFF